MDKSEALTFLLEHQPMPPDSQLSTELIGSLDEVRRFLIDNPIDEALPLILNVFGEGSGFGIYQLIEDAVASYPYEKVVLHLKNNLQSPSRSIRYWNAEIAARFPDKSLVNPLTDLLHSEDIDLRSSAITALVDIDDFRVDGLLRDAYGREFDPETKAQLADAIGVRSGN